MKLALDQSAFVDEPGAMGGDGERRRADTEPRGFIARAWAAGAPAVRRAVHWFFGDRDEADQVGLLAGRTLLLSQPRDTPPPDRKTPPASPGNDER
jgi:hypothetical protein